MQNTSCIDHGLLCLWTVTFTHCPLRWTLLHCVCVCIFISLCRWLTREFLSDVRTGRKGLSENNNKTPMVIGGGLQSFFHR